MATRLRMSTRSALVNTSKYPTDEIRQLVRFAVQEVDMSSVYISVKGSRPGVWRGRAYVATPSRSPAFGKYRRMIVLAISERLPLPIKGHRYPGTKSSSFPVYDLNTWQEVVVLLAAHEAKHIEQFREWARRGKPRGRGQLGFSEIACEHFAVWMLKRYREQSA